MILSTAVFLTGLGVVVWALAEVFSYRGIAVLGAVLVVGVGTAVMVGGLEYQAGETQIETDGGNTTEIEYEYQEIGTTSSFPTGMILTLLGGTMMLRSIDPEL